MLRVKRIVILALCILFILPATTARAAEYKVAANDSLYKISQLFKVPVDSIKLDNNLQADTIYPGQVIYVPAHNYRVKSSDSLFLIARKYGISITSLRQANSKWDDSIYPDQLLIIPGTKPEADSDSVISYTQSEVDLLARLIEAEASGESYQAKLAVGAVVINRVQSKQWAPTIKDVIYQKYGEYYQFTPVKNGMINNTASEASVRAAWSALFGADPSRGAIYYFDESSKNTWLWSKTQTAHIDHMIFVK